MGTTTASSTPRSSPRSSSAASTRRSRSGAMTPAGADRARSTSAATARNAGRRGIQPPMSAVGSAQDRHAMALGAAYLFGAGATLVVITLVLPHKSNTDDVGVLAMALLAYVVVAALLVVGRRIPVWAYELIIAVGGVLVGGCVYFGGESSGAYALMYVWVALYAFYFFDLLAAVAITGFSVATYALILGLKDVSAVPSVAWLMAAGTVFVAGTLVARLVFEIRAHNRDLATVAEIANGMTTEAEVRGARDALCSTVRASLRASAV